MAPDEKLAVGALCRSSSRLSSLVSAPGVRVVSQWTSERETGELGVTISASARTYDILTL